LLTDQKAIGPWPSWYYNVPDGLGHEAGQYKYRASKRTQDCKRVLIALCSGTINSAQGGFQARYKPTRELRQAVKDLLDGNGSQTGSKERGSERTAMPEEQPTKERPAVEINDKLNEDKLDNDRLDNATMHKLMDQVKGRVKGAARRAAVLAGNCRRLHYIQGNGNCQFRAIAAQHLGDQERWHQICAQACQHIRNNLHNANYAAQAVSNYPSLKAWCIDMEQPSTWGNKLSLLAAAHALDLRILVFSESHDGQMHRFYPEAGAKPTIFLHLVDMHYELDTTCGPSPPSPPPPSPPLRPSARPARASRTLLPLLPTLPADIEQRVRTEMHYQAQTFRCLTPKHAISRAAE
jgi:hypothetical protein